MLLRSWMGDHSPAVRMGLAKYLAPLIHRLPRALHEPCLSQIDDIIEPRTAAKAGDANQDNSRAGSPSTQDSFATPEEADASVSFGAGSFFHTGNWRLRKTVASQLGIVAELVDPDLVIRYLVPCALQLCSDCVVAVREEAGRQLGAFLWVSLNREGDAWEKLRELILGTIKGFSVSDRYVLRCLASVILMGAQRIGVDLFLNQELVNVVEALKQDAVIDVRLRVEGIASHLGEHQS